jgi:peptidoglycan/LPS O-acetylase OafA/YrhL
MGIDCLRGLAAVGVLVGHSSSLHSGAPPGGLLGQALSHASVTLYLFFAVSGYLIGGPYVRAVMAGDPLPDVRGYALRRLARIFPAYWVALTAYILLAGPGDATPLAVAVHIPLLQGFFAAQPRAVYPIAWTLGVEVMFYAAVPVLARAVHRDHPLPPAAMRRLLRILTLAAIGLTGIAVELFPANDARDAFGGWAEVVNFSLVGCLVYFVPGVVVAWAEAASAPGFMALRARPRATLALATGLWAAAVLIAQLSLVGAGSELAGRLVLCLATGVTLIAATGAGAKSTWLRPLAFLGTVSYGIYLWHYVVRGLGLAHLSRMNPGDGPLAYAIIAAGLLVVTLPLAAASWYLLERPLIRGAHRRARAHER